MLPISYCKSSPSEYANDGHQFYCPECMNGFYPTLTDAGMPNCSFCGNIITNGCTACSDEEHCSQCAHGYLLQPDGSECITKIANCTLSFSEYDVTSEGRFWCSECYGDLVWNFDSEQCDTCSNIFNGCDSCAVDGCTACQDGYQLSPDGACWDSITDCLAYDWLFEDGEFFPVCSKCETGYFYDVECEECKECEESIDYCSCCSADFEQDDELDWVSIPMCDACSGGYMPEFT